ncbi:RDD family protein [Methylophilaceae bacterium]|nr:RDD family protein [Methylophilaceae bacterium]
MKTNYILRLYGCLFYEILIQTALWFLVAFITIFISTINSTDQPHIFQFILWVTSGVYFVSSWYYGGQTLAMKAWKIKLELPIKNKFIFCVLRYFLACIGLILFFIFYMNILFGSKQYLHDLIMGLKIRDVRIS